MIDSILLLIILGMPVVFMLCDPPSKEWLEQQDRDLDKLNQILKWLHLKK
jgi:hypothetical protein